MLDSKSSSDLNTVPQSVYLDLQNEFLALQGRLHDDGNTSRIVEDYERRLRDLAESHSVELRRLESEYVKRLDIVREECAVSSTLSLSSLAGSHASEIAVYVAEVKRLQDGWSHEVFHLSELIKELESDKKKLLRELLNCKKELSAKDAAILRLSNENAVLSRGV